MHLINKKGYIAKENFRLFFFYNFESKFLQCSDRIAYDRDTWRKMHAYRFDTCLVETLGHDSSLVFIVYT